MKFNPFCRSVKHPVLLWDRGRVCGRPLLREYVPTNNNAKGGPLTSTGVLVRQIYHPVHSLPWYGAYTLVDLLGRNDCRAFHILFHQILCCFSHHLILISLHYSPFPLWLSTSPPPLCQFHSCTAWGKGWLNQSLLSMTTIRTYLGESFYWVTQVLSVRQKINIGANK